jgi:hypothetical protein
MASPVLVAPLDAVDPAASPVEAPIGAAPLPCDVPLGPSGAPDDVPDAPDDDGDPLPASLVPLLSLAGLSGGSGWGLNPHPNTPATIASAPSTDRSFLITNSTRMRPEAFEHRTCHLRNACGRSSKVRWI